MAIDDRYVFVEKPPQTGETLANLPLLKKYAEILNAAESNAQKGEGTYYMAEPFSREVSYSYIFNSIYRELLKWQNKQPENYDIPAMRQAMVELFKYVVEQEFPHIGNNYEIRPDFIEFDTKNLTTGEILDPKPGDLTEKDSIEADNALQHTLSQIVLQKAILMLDKFMNENEEKQVYEEGSRQERQKAKKFDDVSFGVLRKMQYYLTEKMSDKQVYSFQSTEEQARAFRNTLKKQIEPLTHMNFENAANFERNQQVLSNTLDGLGMRMVWCQEPPYEAEFVDNLYFMKKDLQQEQTPPEFYNTKLPIFLNLCEKMKEFNPDETQKMSGLLNDFMEKPSKSKLIEVIEETQRTAMELREIDQTKSIVMRAAWNGLIKMPSEKQLSPVIDDILKIRNYIGRQNLSVEAQEKVDAYLKADYTPESYKNALEKNKIWNVCKEVPQFAALEDALLNQMKAMSISPENVANLKYADIAFLLNRRNVSKQKTLSDTSGVEIPSDKAEYLKNLVAEHEKELRQTLHAFYRKKHTQSLTLEGRKQNLSKQEIAQSIAEKADKMTDKAISRMKRGISNEDFNAHHIFPLSNIAYFERVTGKSFAEINKNILYINKDIHELLHINENAMDEKGRLHFGKDMACRTKYIHRDRMLKHGNKVTGYYDAATMGIIMPKDGIKVMVDFNSYIFDAEKLAENVKLQEQTIEYRQAYDTYMLNQAQKHIIDDISQIPDDESAEFANVKGLGKQLKQVSHPRQYCGITDQLYRIQQALTEALKQEDIEPTPTQQKILNLNSKYYQPLAVVPHVSTAKVSMFLTQAADFLKNKAKEIVLSVKDALQDEQPAVHPEMNKARQMVQAQNTDEQKAVNVALQPQKVRKMPQVRRKDEQYA